MPRGKAKVKEDANIVEEVDTIIIEKENKKVESFVKEKKTVTITHKERVLFTVEDVDIYDNTIYRLKFKKDLGVPEEMQVKGYSRYPGANVTTKCGVFKDKYETGFEESSRIYAHYTDYTTKKAEVNQRRDNVLIPYLEFNGMSENDVKPTSYDFWDSYTISLDDMKTFNTANVDERFELYIALVSKAIVPSSAWEMSYKYDTASYTLESNKSKVKKGTNTIKLKARATSLFETLVSKKPNSVVDILVYSGDKSLHKSKFDEDVMYAILENRILKTISATEEFIELAEKVLESNAGETEIKVNRIIESALITKNSNFGKNGIIILYKGQELGNGTKDSARLLVTNENYADILSEIVLEAK